MPLKFSPKTGNPVSQKLLFQGPGEPEELPEFFHRRHVGFVTWDESRNCKPYETYDEMDRHLGLVHTAPVRKDASTTFVGPFGVFDGSGPPTRPTADRPPTGRKAPPPNPPDTAPHDQLWLSNELRDDALLTAAALNGDTQFLDFMGSLLPTHGVVPSPSAGYAANSSYQNDFLNLVFHRNTHANMGAFQTPPPAATTLNGAFNYNFLNPYQQNENLEIHLHASRTAGLHDDRAATDIVEGDSGATEMPDLIMAIVQSPLQPKVGFDLTLPKGPGTATGLPNTALQVQPLTRYLLNYYVTEVADLMTVIPLTDNPWKTIYFPRALTAVGELAALGQTSPAKNALLNALLAVSAFNLQSKFPKNSDQMKYYLHLGIRLRNQALLFVKRLLGSSSDSKSIEQCLSTEKYKDVLCAVMTMISVDLVWGTMQDTNFYVRWCGRVIATKMANKTKLSSKARILHRVFSSLKLIQDLTCLDIGSIRDDESRNGYDVNGDNFAKIRDPVALKGRIDFIVNGSLGSRNTSPLFVDKKLINTKRDDENFATDALYGLPNLLILLFSQTVQLLRTKIHHQDQHQTPPPGFEAQATALSAKLLLWKLDWQLYNEGGETFALPMHEATFHHIMSFYHALTIYFKRLIDGIAPLEVQTAVEKTLGHLDAIQKLIARGEAVIIPLFWQGFIAGCEATLLHLQMGFKKWGADIAQYLGSYWGARQIMLEVWRRKRMNEARDDWVSVIQDWEMNLMLN